MSADIVEILRATECDREPFTPAHVLCSCRLANDAANEIERLRAGGCARDQTTTQYCAEVVARDAEIERLRAASQWRPIDENTPKNESVLVWWPRREYYGSCAYCAMLIDMGSGVRWMSYGVSIGRDVHEDPTHWQPLPSPPTQEGGGT
jgi:hypothetical protein